MVAAGNQADHRNNSVRDRRRTPLGDSREHAVPCVVCGAETWNIDPVCDRCDRRLPDLPPMRPPGQN
jgi:hypothetical protein